MLLLCLYHYLLVPENLASQCVRMTRNQLLILWAESPSYHHEMDSLAPHGLANHKHNKHLNPGGTVPNIFYYT